MDLCVLGTRIILSGLTDCCKLTLNDLQNQVGSRKSEDVLLRSSPKTNKLNHRFKTILFMYLLPYCLKIVGNEDMWVQKVLPTDETNMNLFYD